jgi:hypothetical protein
MSHGAVIAIKVVHIIEFMQKCDNFHKAYQYLLFHFSFNAAKLKSSKSTMFAQCKCTNVDTSEQSEWNDKES